MSTYSTIGPILRRTYGDGGMVDALAHHLASKIDLFEPLDDRDTRERMVMLTCWDWMTGGTTAASVARDIEAALTAAEAPA